MPPINVLMKPASGMCNMSCNYCFYCDETRKRKQESYGFMSEQTLKNVIRKTLLRAEGYISFAYQGGEPTLRGIGFFRKAMEYQQQYNKHGIKVMNALQTNGMLIDEEWCEFLTENHFLVGISIDGTKDTHDRYRHAKGGEATYDRIYHATEMMDRYGVEYNILTVVHKQTAQDIQTIYKTYKKRGWNYQQYIACFDPIGELHGQSEYALEPMQYGEFLIQLFELWYQDGGRNTEIKPYIRQFENYLSMLLGYRPEACDQYGNCGIQYVVEADGSVYPCDFYMMDEYWLGNFNEHQLQQMDERRLQIGFVERSRKLSEKCTHCSYFQLCRGGCQRNRDYNKETDRYENYFCEAYQMFFQVCGGKMLDLSRAIR